MSERRRYAARPAILAALSLVALAAAAFLALNGLAVPSLIPAALSAASTLGLFLTHRSGVASLSAEAAARSAELESARAAEAQAKAALARSAAPSAEVPPAAEDERVVKLRGALESLERVVSFAGQVVMDVSSSSMGLDAFTGMQASSIEQVSASIMEMDQGLREAALEAGRRREAAEGLVRVVKDGGRGVGETDRRMKLIARDVARIKDIATIIDDIAERTRLLGMNAAIEAAHAGPAGRGFQVIATEIRKLSDSTTMNSRGIADSVASIGESVQTALSASAGSAETFSRIDAEVAEFIAALGAIADRMGALSASSSGILASVSQVGEVTQSIKENAQAMLASSERIERSLDEVRAEMAGMRELSDMAKAEAAEVVARSALAALKDAARSPEPPPETPGAGLASPPSPPEAAPEGKPAAPGDEEPSDLEEIGLEEFL